MGDEKKDYEIWIDEYVKSIQPYSYNDDMGSIDFGDTSWNYEPKIGANDISLTGGGEEMLRIAEDGFYVRGVKVKQNKREAKAVYEAFKRWMTHAIISGELNDR